MYKNIILSYPRSGNHLTRFFIELLSETPTFGRPTNPEDTEIYKNIFSEKIPFNISKNFNIKNAFFKYHNPPKSNVRVEKLILIVRNPREVLLRQSDYTLNFHNGRFCYDAYFQDIDFFNNHKGKKLLLFYEDIITDKKKFIETLYEFLSIDNIQKKNYVLNNIHKLYDLSANGKNRAWGGVVSQGTNFYYPKIPQSIKREFDSYLDDKLKKYPFLKEKYKIE